MTIAAVKGKSYFSKQFVGLKQSDIFRENYFVNDHSVNMTWERL